LVRSRSSDFFLVSSSPSEMATKGRVMPEEKKTGIAGIYKFFGPRAGQSIKDFSDEYKELTDEDKAQLREGIDNGSLTY
jgi:hypothetical protein